MLRFDHDTFNVFYVSRPNDHSCCSLIDKSFEYGMLLVSMPLNVGHQSNNLWIKEDTRAAMLNSQLRITVESI